MEEVKQQITIKEGLPVDVYVLMYQHQRLENHLRLSDYMIGHMAHLSVLFRLGGGSVDPNQKRWMNTWLAFSVLLYLCLDIKITLIGCDYEVKYQPYHFNVDYVPLNLPVGVLFQIPIGGSVHLRWSQKSHIFIPNFATDQYFYDPYFRSVTVKGIPIRGGRDKWSQSIQKV